VPPPELPLTAPACTRQLRRVCATAVVLTVLLSSGACSNAAIDKAAGAGAGSGIAVTTSATGLAIENHTTRPLLNVRVSVTAAGATSPFVRVVPTIDRDQQQEIPFAELQSEAGSPLDAQANAPERATVSARDTLGNSYSAAAAW
jgi:hypothetical protein